MKKKAEKKVKQDKQQGKVFFIKNIKNKFKREEAEIEEETEKEIEEELALEENHK